MLRFLGIVSISVEGYIKDLLFEPGDAVNTAKHIWSIAYVSDTQGSSDWHLFDVATDAENYHGFSYTESRRTSQQSFSLNSEDLNDTRAKSVCSSKSGLSIRRKRSHFKMRERFSFEAEDLNVSRFFNDDLDRPTTSPAKTKARSETLYTDIHHLIDDAYFSPSPFDMVKTHFPLTPEYQLAIYPMGLRQFETLPVTRDIFPSLNLSLRGSSGQPIVHTQDGEVELSFSYNLSRLLHFNVCLIHWGEVKWHDAGDTCYLTKIDQKEKSAEITIFARLPSKGQYRLSLEAAPIVLSNELIIKPREVACFKVIWDDKGQRSSSQTKPHLPVLSCTGFGPVMSHFVSNFKFNDLTKFGRIVCENGFLELSLTCSIEALIDMDYKIAVCYYDHVWQETVMVPKEMSKLEKDYGESSIRVKAEFPHVGEFSLRIDYFVSSSNIWTNLVNYLVIVESLSTVEERQGNTGIVRPEEVAHMETVFVIPNFVVTFVEDCDLPFQGNIMNSIQKQVDSVQTEDLLELSTEDSQEYLHVPDAQEATQSRFGEDIHMGLLKGPEISGGVFLFEMAQVVEVSELFMAEVREHSMELEITESWSQKGNENQDELFQQEINGDGNSEVDVGAGHDSVSVSSQSKSEQASKDELDYQSDEKERKSIADQNSFAKGNSSSPIETQNEIGQVEEPVASPITEAIEEENTLPSDAGSDGEVEVKQSFDKFEQETGESSMPNETNSGLLLISNEDSKERKSSSGKSPHIIDDQDSVNGKSVTEEELLKVVPIAKIGETEEEGEPTTPAETTLSAEEQEVEEELPFDTETLATQDGQLSTNHSSVQEEPTKPLQSEELGNDNGVIKNDHDVKSDIPNFDSHSLTTEDEQPEQQIDSDRQSMRKTTPENEPFEEDNLTGEVEETEMPANIPRTVESPQADIDSEPSQENNENEEENQAEIAQVSHESPIPVENKLSDPVHQVGQDRNSPDEINEGDVRAETDDQKKLDHDFGGLDEDPNDEQTKSHDIMSSELNSKLPSPVSQQLESELNIEESDHDSPKIISRAETLDRKSDTPGVVNETLIPTGTNDFDQSQDEKLELALTSNDPQKLDDDFRHSSGRSESIQSDRNSIAENRDLFTFHFSNDVELVENDVEYNLEELDVNELKVNEVQKAAVDITPIPSPPPTAIIETVQIEEAVLVESDTQSQNSTNFQQSTEYQPSGENLVEKEESSETKSVTEKELNPEKVFEENYTSEINEEIIPDEKEENKELDEPANDEKILPPKTLRTEKAEIEENIDFDQELNTLSEASGTENAIESSIHFNAELYLNKGEEITIFEKKSQSPLPDSYFNFRFFEPVTDSLVESWNFSNCSEILMEKISVFTHASLSNVDFEQQFYSPENLSKTEVVSEEPVLEPALQQIEKFEQSMLLNGQIENNENNETEPSVMKPLNNLSSIEVYDDKQLKLAKDTSQEIYSSEKVEHASQNALETDYIIPDQNNTKSNDQNTVYALKQTDNQPTSRESIKQQTGNTPSLSNSEVSLRKLEPTSPSSESKQRRRNSRKSQGSVSISNKSTKHKQPGTPSSIRKPEFSRQNSTKSVKAPTPSKSVRKSAPSSRKESLKSKPSSSGSLKRPVEEITPENFINKETSKNTEAFDQSNLRDLPAVGSNTPSDTWSCSAVEQLEIPEVILERSREGTQEVLINQIDQVNLAEVKSETPRQEPSPPPPTEPEIDEIQPQSGDESPQKAVEEILPEPPKIYDTEPPVDDDEDGLGSAEPPGIAADIEPDNQIDPDMTTTDNPENNQNQLEEQINQQKISAADNLNEQITESLNNDEADNEKDVYSKTEPDIQEAPKVGEEIEPENGEPEDNIDGEQPLNYKSVAAENGYHQTENQHENDEAPALPEDDPKSGQSQAPLSPSPPIESLSIPIDDGNNSSSKISQNRRRRSTIDKDQKVLDIIVKTQNQKGPKTATATSQPTYRSFISASNKPKTFESSPQIATYADTRRELYQIETSRRAKPDVQNNSNNNRSKSKKTRQKHVDNSEFMSSSRESGIFQPSKTYENLKEERSGTPLVIDSADEDDGKIYEINKEKLIDLENTFDEPLQSLVQAETSEKIHFAKVIPERIYHTATIRRTPENKERVITEIQGVLDFTEEPIFEPEEIIYDFSNADETKDALAIEPSKPHSFANCTIELNNFVAENETEIIEDKSFEKPIAVSIDETIKKGVFKKSYRTPWQLEVAISESFEMTDVPEFEKATLTDYTVQKEPKQGKKMGKNPAKIYGPDRRPKRFQDSNYLNRDLREKPEELRRSQEITSRFRREMKRLNIETDSDSVHNTTVPFNLTGSEIDGTLNGNNAGTEDVNNNNNNSNNNNDSQNVNENNNNTNDGKDSNQKKGPLIVKLNRATTKRNLYQPLTPPLDRERGSIFVDPVGKDPMVQEPFRHKSFNRNLVRELKSYRKPGSVVKSILKATFIILGESPLCLDDWDILSGLLSRSLYKDSLTVRMENFKSDSLTSAAKERAQEVLSHIQEDDIDKISKPVKILLDWVRSNL